MKRHAAYAVAVRSLTWRNVPTRTQMISVKAYLEEWESNMVRTGTKFRPKALLLASLRHRVVPTAIVANQIISCDIVGRA